MNAFTSQSAATTCTFTQRLPSTRHGAHLARHLTVVRLHTWKVSPDVTERAEQIVAELAANAALHGHVAGRDFQLALTLDDTVGDLRLAVTDARGGQLPTPSAASGTTSDAESGRGLLLVAALADRWGTGPCPPGGKTVWAHLSTGDPETGEDHPSCG